METTELNNILYGAPSSAADAPADEQPRQLLYLIDLTRHYPAPHYTFRLGGIPTVPRGDIFAIKAKSKNGKSYLASILAASALGCTDFGGEPAEEGPNRVLYFDTEQNELNTARLARRVNALCHHPVYQNFYDEFQAYSLRLMPLEERLPFIKETLGRECEEARVKPTIVIIDGVVDLIQNFNEISQSSALVQELLLISTEYDVAVGCVIHTNKSQEDNNMRGHLGSFLVQKASDVFSVCRKGKTFCVEETECRNRPVSDFAFAIDEEGMPEVVKLVENTAATAFETDCRRCLPLVYDDSIQTGFSFLDLKKALTTVGLTPGMAQRRINWARDNSILAVRDKLYVKGPKWDAFMGIN